MVIGTVNAMNEVRTHNVSGDRNCKVRTHNVSGDRNCKVRTHNVSGDRNCKSNNDHGHDVTEECSGIITLLTNILVFLSCLLNLP